jgi:hypothetical protein
MQTITVQIQDNYMSAFMSYINNHSENITIEKDENLKLLKLTREEEAISFETYLTKKTIKL